MPCSRRGARVRRNDRLSLEAVGGTTRTVFQKQSGRSPQAGARGVGGPAGPVRRPGVRCRHALPGARGGRGRRRWATTPPDRATLTRIARHAGLPPRARSDVAEPRAGPLPALTTRGPAVVLALPFLILVQLYRLGCEEPAAAALLAAGRRTQTAWFAAAVAGKVVDPPERGWRREPNEHLAIELVSGLTSEQVDAAATRWADQSEVLLTLAQRPGGAVRRRPQPARGR